MTERRNVMKKVLSMLCALAAAAVLVVLPTVTAAHASGCTNATVTGNYGIISSGFSAKKGPMGNEFPAALVGVATFDGAGNFSATWTNAFNGEIARGLNGSGTYTVNSDCTGSFAFTSGDAAGFTFDAAIVNSGAEVFLIATLSGATITYDLKKQ
jgi:hypothetical protein